MINFREIANRLSDGNRLRKYRLFIDCFKPTANIRILDVGASEKEYQKHANILEKKYPYPENITVLGVNIYREFLTRYPRVKTITYKGEIFPFDDKEFDICWCNAVIEHVGNRNKQVNFLKEIKRVAKSAYITTPNRHFPFELHTKIFVLHYLPKVIFDKILVKLGKSWATCDYMYLLSLRELKELLAKANITKYKIVKNKIFGFTVNYVIIF